MNGLSMAEFDGRIVTGTPPRGAVHRRKQLARPGALGQATDPQARDAITPDDIIAILGQYGYTLQEDPIAPDDELITVPAGELERSQEEGGVNYVPDIPVAEYWPEDEEPADSWTRVDPSTAPEPDYVLTDAEQAALDAAEAERLAAEQRAAEEAAAAAIAEEAPPVIEDELPPPKPSMLPVIALVGIALMIMGK